MERYDAEALTRWMGAVFEACRVSPADARCSADILARTSLRGIDTHGVSRVPAYVDRLLSGEVDPQAVPRAEWRDGALHIDGAAALGQLVAPFAVAEAVERSRELAAVSCTIRNSGHLGALGVFVLQAAEQGRIAFLCQKTPPLIALPGSSRAAIGNNPLAFAAPLGGGRPPLVFDMAASVVARGQVLQAARDGNPIPDDWALAPDGSPTTDAALALQGAMRPAGGHKGIGLAMLVECLAGSLAGSMTLSQGSHQDSGSAGGISAFLLVVNPDRFLGRAAFDASMDEWLQHYLRSGGPQARYPGQRQAASEAGRRAGGIPVPASVLRELAATGERVGQRFDLQPVA